MIKPIKPIPPAPEKLEASWALIEHSPLAMAIIEATSQRVVHANPAFAQQTATPLEKILGASFCDLLPQRALCHKALQRVLRTGLSEHHTERGKQSPAEFPPILWFYTFWPILEENRPVGIVVQIADHKPHQEETVAMNEALIVGAVRQHELAEASEKLNNQLRAEISERKQAVEALGQAREELADRALQLERLVDERTAELKASNQQLEAFVYSMAHDLRAPLRAMQGFAAMLVKETRAGLSEQGKDFALRISDSAKFMDTMLQDLLDFSRISQERVELGPVPLLPAIESVVTHFQMEIQEKKATLENLGPWPTVMAHEPTLLQVLINLVSNALKFTKPGLPPRIRLSTRSTREHPQTNQKNRTVRIQVEDNGIGIALDHQEQIFRLFHRLAGKEFEGTGIGLAILQKGVERMKGEVGVESTPGQGSCFWIALQEA